MSTKKRYIWSDCYKLNYKNHFEKFYQELQQFNQNYNSCGKAELTKLSTDYLTFFYETIELLRLFINNNMLVRLDSTRLIVIYLLKCNLLNNGILFYNIYLKMEKLKQTKTIIAKKYLNDKYVDIFVQINNLFKNRISLEENFEI